MTLLIGGAVAIDPVQSRAFTTSRDDSGVSTATLTVTGYTDRDRASLAAAKKIARQLNEMAANPAYRTVHVADDEDSQYDGLYDLQGAGVTATPATSNSKAALFAVSVTLRRIGGAGLFGPNLTRQLRAITGLAANSYSITSTPRLALPIGSTSTESAGVSNRSTKDGSIQLHAGAYRYTLAGPDYLTGECKLFDTGGSAIETDWVRVFGPDHVFANAGHLVLENGLLRIQPMSSRPASWRYWAWTGAAYTELTDAASGDYTFLGGTVVTTTPTSLLIDEVSPDRIVLTFVFYHTVAPIYLTKSVTLWRGKPLALVELSAPSAGALLCGMVNAGRWTFIKGSPVDGAGDMQKPGRDDSVESGDNALNAPLDNWVAAFTTMSSTTGTLAVGAWRSSALSVIATDGGGFYLSASATSLSVYLGGMKYDTSASQSQAEAGGLSAGATLASTVAFGSGAGNNQVSLSALNARLDFNVTALPAGTSVLALFRIASDTAVGANTIALRIRNNTAGTDAATQTRTATDFAAANVWYWQAVTATWNGTDVIWPYVIMTADAGGTFYVDQVVWLTLTGGAAELFVDDVAAQALTESIVWHETLRQVW